MTASSTIRGFFERDHDRLDDLFASYQAHKRSDMGKAKDLFEEFRAGLERHIVWEEGLLFPLWEQKTGMSDAGPTVVMRAEHRQIHQLLDRIQSAIAAGNVESDRAEQGLADILTSHNMKEERVLYPAIDQVMSEEERAGVFRAIEENAAGRQAGT